MAYETPHSKYLTIARATVGLEGKSVLEVGGCTPPALLRNYGPKAWTCINLDQKAVIEFTNQVHHLGLRNYSARFEDITSYEPDRTYDAIYSINACEHIRDLGKAFEVMYRALNPGGYLFALFGPIWSSDVGHHLSVTTECGELHFLDGTLAPWEHLTSTPEAIQVKLEQFHSKSTAEKAVDFIFRYNDLNRLYEHEYLAIVKNSAFTPLLVLRRKKGRPPRVPGASNTRELLLILKKGRVRIWERIGCLSRFGLAYLNRQYNG